MVGTRCFSMLCYVYNIVCTQTYRTPPCLMNVRSWHTCHLTTTVFLGPKRWKCIT